MDLFEQPEPIRIPLQDGELHFYRSIGLVDAEAILARLITDTPWRQEEITVYGKRHRQPRLTAWYGDPGTQYSYSGIELQPLAWTPTLLDLKTAVEKHCDHSFNSVLLNYYRDGQDSMGMHSDDEAELGTEPVIASLSLGEERALLFKHKTRKEQGTVKVPLPDGSLLVMGGQTQRYWRHGLNKLSRSCGPRVNLTFRQITPR